MNHTCLCFPSRSWSSFTKPRGMKGWVGLGTTTVIKQSAQDHMWRKSQLLVVQTVTPHWATAVQALWTSNPWPLRPWATILTTESPIHSEKYNDTHNRQHRQHLTVNTIILHRILQTVNVTSKRLQNTKCKALAVAALHKIPPKTHNSAVL